MAAYMYPLAPRIWLENCYSSHPSGKSLTFDSARASYILGEAICLDQIETT